jgi:predicted flap endonuclease-1-like 5' DNA nuclease
MSPIIAGLGLILLGLIGAFFGYRIFRVLLPIYGGVGGFLLAWGWWGESAWLLALIVGVVLAVVFAVLAYAFWSALVAFAGLIMGGALGVLIGTSLNLWDWLTVLLAIGLAIVFAALFFWVRNEMVIISTAITGGTLTARGVGELFGWRSGLEGTVNPNPTWLSLLVLAVGLVVFIAGLIYQWRAYAKLRWYDKSGAPAVDKSSAAVQGAATRTASSIDAAAGPMGATVTGGGAAVAGAATAAATAAVVTTRSAAADVSETAGDVATDAQGVVADVADTAGEAVSDMGEAVGDAAGGAVDAAEGGLAAAGVAAAGVAAAVGDAAGDATEGAEGAVDAAGDAVADVAGEVTEGAAGAVAAGAVLSDVGDAVADAGEAAENKAEDVVDDAAKALDIDIDENKVANVLADLEKSFEGLEESAKFKEALDFVEGIGPVFAAKLKDVGINNVLDLLRSGATRKGRADLAEKSGIAGKQILEWVNHADLYRVKGVGSEYADLLEAAGVDTVPELAQRNPVKLLEKMLATNEEKRLVRRPPHASEVEDWVGQAKSLPRIIQY